MKEQQSLITIPQAVNALNAGEVIAYPTESCFGLGCDPTKAQAIENIIQLKGRSANKGLILIAATVEQAQAYVTIDESPLNQSIYASWPGPNTWLLPPKDSVLPLLRGEFPLLAIRVTAHPVAKELCIAFGGAIVSTSANLAGEPSLVDARSVQAAFGDQLQVMAGAIGDDSKPSTIRDGLTGQILRQ